LLRQQLGCFSRSLINAVREAKEQGTLLLKPCHLSQQGFALTPFVACLRRHFKKGGVGHITLFA